MNCIPWAFLAFVGSTKKSVLDSLVTWLVSECVHDESFYFVHNNEEKNNKRLQRPKEGGPVSTV